MVLERNLTLEYEERNYSRRSVRAVFGAPLDCIILQNLSDPSSPEDELLDTFPQTQSIDRNTSLSLARNLRSLMLSKIYGNVCFMNLNDLIHDGTEQLEQITVGNVN